MAVKKIENVPLRPGSPSSGDFPSKAARAGRDYGEVRVFTPDGVPLDGPAGPKKQLNVSKENPNVP